MHLRQKLQFSSLPPATASRESTTIAGKFPRLTGAFLWPEAVQLSTNVPATASSWLSTTASAGLCTGPAGAEQRQLLLACSGRRLGLHQLKDSFLCNPVRVWLIYQVLFASKACQEELLVFSMSWSEALIRLSQTKGTSPFGKGFMPCCMAKNSHKCCRR